MLISEIDFENINDDQKTKILFDKIEDDKEFGDLIFVFGSVNPEKYRLPKVIELYKNKRAEKIMVSGGMNKKSEFSETEANYMKNVLLNSGISKEDIIVETKSSNTKENVIFSRAILDEKYGLKNINRILVVTTPYHMRRAILTFKKYMPDWIKYSMCVAMDTNTRPDNWFTNDKGIKRVNKEVESLIKYTRNKEISDMDINI